MCKGTKNVPISQNEVHKVPIAMGANCYLVWHIMLLNCRVWPYVALYGLMHNGLI